jgi:hypothetical protein
MSTPAIPSQPLHDADGKVIAYVVPSDEFEQMKTVFDTFQQQREKYVAYLQATLPTATPEQEAAMVGGMRTAIPNGLRTLLAELEAEGTADGGR